MIWTRHSIEILTRLWNAGERAESIAQHIPGATAAAITAKANYLGLPRRTPPLPNPRKGKANSGSPWNDERDALITKLYRDEGLSCSMIAARIGGVSRNAVIGRLHRLGVSQSRAPRQFRAPRLSRNAAHKTYATDTSRASRVLAIQRQPQFEAEPFVSTHEELVIPEADRKQLIDLTDGDCRWPIGDPQKTGFHFCGKHKVTGLPYCEFHVRRAYQPVSPAPRSPKRNTTERPRIKTFEDAL